MGIRKTLNMEREYIQDELLPLSGIQHFLFCRRQWALIHLENQWRENFLTVEGRILHEQVDDPLFTESRQGRIISRAVPIASYTLGLVGRCDMVEFTLSPNGIELPGRKGYYQPSPIEYKRGKPKREPVDEVQLCAQAMCLEEMLSTEIPGGFIYYGLTRHREQVLFTNELRALVQELCLEMHNYFKRMYTPKVKKSKACRSCSLYDICIPSLQGKKESASVYISSYIESLKK